MPGGPELSPILKSLLDGEFFDRLPVTFASYCLDRVKDWALLFPAERDYFERLFTLLDRSAPDAVERLFAPVRELEAKMGIDDRVWPKRRFTLEQVDFLNRNPHYPEWRSAVSAVFARLDPLLDAEQARRGHARLSIVIAPSEIPAAPERMWTRIARHGRRVRVEAPERVEDHVSMLLTGAPKAERAPSIVELWASGRPGLAYDAWVVEAGDSGACGPGSPGVVRLGYQRLDPYRRRLMKDVNRMVRSEDIRGPRELGARLKELKIQSAESDFASDPLLAEFARSVLLNGNGTLLINNTFVEWAAVQAIRRARPSVMVAGFGIRSKIKPFSSLLIYEDQEAVNAIPSQMDTLGTYVDLEVFYQYLWQEFEKHVEYRGNTVHLFVLEGADELFVIAPPDFSLGGDGAALRAADVFARLRAWMGV